MASLLRKTNLLSQLRSHSQKSAQAVSVVPRRGFHSQLGDREKALLAEHPALKRFPSHNGAIRKIKFAGDALAIVVMGGCAYELFYRAAAEKPQ